MTRRRLLHGVPSEFAQAVMAGHSAPELLAADQINAETTLAAMTEHQADLTGSHEAHQKVHTEGGLGLIHEAHQKEMKKQKVRIAELQAELNGIEQAPLSAGANCACWNLALFAPMVTAGAFGLVIGWCISRTRATKAY